jgi:hypothetical protein
VDFEEDTLFISDPVFALREPIKAFLDAEHVKKLSKIAIASDIYEGLERSGTEFPTLCDRPAAILRKLEGLKHFTLALSEDGELAVYDGLRNGSDGGYDNGDEDDEGNDSGIEDVDAVASGSYHTGQEAQVDRPATTTEVDARNIHTGQRLDRLEREALSEMSKGYVRHVGNIHFETAMGSPDHWDDWDYYRTLITAYFHKEKAEHPEWSRPKVSIMVVKYGLKQFGDISGPFHIRGDHQGVILEDSEYPPSETESDSQLDQYLDIDDWDAEDFFMGEYEEEDYDAIWAL